MHNSDAAFSAIAGKWIYHIRMSAEIRRAKQGRQAMSYPYTPLFANMCVCRLGRSSSHQSEHRATLQQQVVEGREGELFLWLARLRKYSGGAVPESMSCDLDAPRLPCLMLKEVFALIKRGTWNGRLMRLSRLVLRREKPSNLRESCLRLRIASQERWSQSEHT